MVFLSKFSAGNIYINVTLIVRETLLEGDVCPVTGTTWALILDFCWILNHRSKVLSIMFCFLFDGI